MSLLTAVADRAGAAVLHVRTIRDGRGGLGFAVPSNTASFVAAEILAHGRARRAFVGIDGEEVLLRGPTSRRRRRTDPRAVAAHPVEQESPAAALRPRERAPR